MSGARKRVFILGGGAALGAHQVGALRYLVEEGITPDAFLASSIGVVNACVYASGGIEQLEVAWRGFHSWLRICAPSLQHNPFVGLSLFSMDRLVAAVEAHIDFDTVYASPLELEFVLLNLSTGCGQFYRKSACDNGSELRTLSRAGYAVPLLFPPIHFRGDWLVDGGFAWNIPLERALALGATEIYLLAPITSQLSHQTHFGSMVALTRRFIDVMWRTIPNAGYLYASMEDGCFHGVPVTVIEPGEEWSGFGPFTIFSAHPRKNQALMAAGYRDAARIVASRHSQTYSAAS